MESSGGPRPAQSLLAKNYVILINRRYRCDLAVHGSIDEAKDGGVANQARLR